MQPSRMKGRAPQPPPQPAPRRILTTTQNCKVLQSEQNPRDMKENVLPGTVDLLVVLPNGAEKSIEVNESKAVMDLLIDLCSQYHLNPTHHTLELQSRETRKPLGFKPNTAVGILDVDKVLIKQKVIEDKPRRPRPVVPEKTVRLIVNFLRTQKAVLRVSPLVPLQELLPVICEKCDFNLDHLVLLKDCIRREKVDLSKSLNDLETRELYALDTSRDLSQSALAITGVNEKEDKGLLGFLKIGKKKTKKGEQMILENIDCGGECLTPAECQSIGYSTAPPTPNVNTRSATLNPSLSASDVSRMCQTMDVKKRRAPPPPSAPPEHTNVKRVEDSAQEIGAESLNSMQKKRRAPAPPPIQNKLEGAEFDRSNTIGIAGCQVPPKPPRGTSPVSGKPRNPPQLMIPPPPTYPPPTDNENMNQPGMSPDYDFTNAVPERGESISESESGSEQGGGVGDDIMEIESRDGEQAAKSSDNFQQSCSNYTPASEGELLKSDDAGTIISQSVMFSTLTSSLRLRNKTETDEILGASDKIFGTEEHPAQSNEQKSTKDKGITFGDNTTRFETTTHTESNWKEEDKISIAAQVNLSLAELDAELAAMQEELAFKKSSTLSDRTVDEQETVPVTIIDEVPWTCQEEVEEILLEKLPTPSKVEGLSNADRSGETNSKITTAIFITNTCELPPSDISSNISDPSSVVNCVDMPSEPVKKGIENLHRGIKGVQDEMKPGENEFKMAFTATELAYDIHVRENSRKKMHSTAPAEVDTVVLEDRNRQLKHGRQVEQYSAATHGPEHILTSDRWLITANKITNECVPKVGMRTFTVIPPKPTVKPQQREYLSLNTSAIKIDDQGNLIHAGINEIKSKETPTNSLANDKESLVGRAKAFWNVKSTVKDNLQCANTAKIMKINKPECTAGELQLQEPEKQLTNIFPTSDAAATCAVSASTKRIKTYSQSTEESVMPLNGKITSMPVNSQPKIKNNFIRPCRRTSSQYVASAISCYTGLQSTKTETGTESNAQSGTGFESNSDDKHKFRSAEEKSSPKSSKRNCLGSQLKTEFALHSSCNTDNATKVLNRTNILLQKSLDTEAVPNQNWLIKDTSEQVKAFNKITYQSQRSQLIIKESVSTNEQCTTAKSPQNTFQSSVVKGVISSAPSDQTINMTKTLAFTSASTSFSNSLKTHSTKTRQSDCISDNLPASDLQTSSTTTTVTEDIGRSEHSPSFYINSFNIKPNTNMFGPVKKFKPIIQKPVQKDECIHSSLMKAIQSGQNKERLRKTSDKVMHSNQKKSSFIAVENEHSALLASIRAHSGISKLKKTTSTASKEIQDPKNVASSSSTREYFQTRQPEMQSPPSPPPPPPPPPSDFTKTGKFSTKSIANQEDARTALLKAIQSGTGAARLRKVSVPLNTIQVNGRTSSIQISNCWTPSISS
ncbi:protein cordon-bleu isoform X2 [Pristis pectinata]|uniref:protein cordon-bleu isoform X2 n=1 Tax=Pristis pectinata TaxID=685728 RepID=UPI00223E89AE|nr:protein cordon-bleu isoform X2 [Pristis pectinata]